MALDPMDRDEVKVIHKTTLHDGRLKVIDVRYEAPLFAGGMGEAASREVVQRQDAAAALVHDIERDVIILCEQFRAPAYLAGGGWLIELPAGKVDGEETPEDCIRRELEEEIGYRARDLDPIATYFAAPGYSTERVHLFYAPVIGDDLIDEAAHGVDAGEDVRRVEQPLKTFLERVRLGKFEDSKIMAAGAWAVTRLGKGK
ncbi:MAG TPA: NUDIX hydrolase [Caulobacterales bacterium]|nr:NUDIX hydrolase [Caulobacterales bacterium]